MVRLDAFYTRPRVARRCVGVAREVLGGNVRYFIEPSAGRCDFYDALPLGHRMGMDVVPSRSDICAQDFLCWRPQRLPFAHAERIVIGNPPFGKRAKNAIAFFNHATQFAANIAFIVPIIFRKYFVHKQLPMDWKWIHSEPLPHQAFYTEKGKPYGVQAEFQIWTRLPAPRYANQRLFSPPPIAHPHFTMNQYNNTPQAEKYFGMPFDFAVPCQGWQDYSRREKKASACERSKQWMLLKAGSKEARERLYSGIDYEALSRKYTTTVPGFRKADLVQEYRHCFG